MVTESKRLSEGVSKQLSGGLRHLHYGTWIGMFTTDKIFKADMQDTLKPEKVWWKNEEEFMSPSEMIMRAFKPDGIKTGEWT
jgi:hypothetical protein